MKVHFLICFFIYWDYDLDVEELLDISTESIESLQQFIHAQLVVLCQQRRLPYSGNKLHLAERLLNYGLTRLILEM